MGSVTYTFVAKHAGTYLYESGTNAELQDQMGLIGALFGDRLGLHRRCAATRTTSSGDAAGHQHVVQADKEYLNFLSEVDPDLNQKVEFAPDQSAYVFDLTD